MTGTTGAQVDRRGDRRDRGRGEGGVTTRRLANGSLVPVAAAVPARRRRAVDERGMVSAEWAVAIIAAVSLAGVVIMIVGSGPVKDALLKFILLVIKQFSSIAGI